MSECKPLVRGATPVEVHLLSPAGRPVQVTTDLASFWAVAYFDVCRAGAYTCPLPSST